MNKSKGSDPPISTLTSRGFSHDFLMKKLHVSCGFHLEAAEPFQMLPCQSLQSLRLGLHDLDGAWFFCLITMEASPWNKLQN